MKLANVACVVIVLGLVLTAGGQVRGPGAGLRPVEENGRWGYADRSGRMVIEARFDAAEEFKGGLAKVGVADGGVPGGAAKPTLRWGYIDESGRVAVELRYRVLHDFAEGLAAAAVPDPAAAGSVEDKEGVFVRRDRLPALRWGYVDAQGREVIAPQFFAAGDFSEGLAAVDVGGTGGGMCERPSKYGYVDRTGAMRIAPQFAIAAAFKGGQARVGVGERLYVGRCLCCGPRFVGTYGYVDREGKFTPDAPKDGAAPRDDAGEWEDEG